MPRCETYNHVVVGGGSAGCVLASRLSADPLNRVLLLESGGSDWHPLLRIPLGVGMIWSRRLFDWGLDSEPEPNLAGRRIEMMRGHVLGGSSSINALSHVRGHPGDFDRWARSGCPGWSYSDVLPFFRKLESWEGGESSHRGGSGPIRVVFSRSEDALFDAWLDAARSLGLPITDDYNGAAPEGFGRSQFAMARGRRCSASQAYLRPVMERRNLTVRTRAVATRVILEHGRAVGVEYRARSGPSRAYADGEVILAAGVFGTPKLLMLSGIGPAADLRQHGIDAVMDHPAVGQNLQDHLGAVISYARSQPSAFRNGMRFDRIAAGMLQAWALGTGPATVLPSGLHGFVRVEAGSETPDIQFMFRGAPRDAAAWFPGIRPAYADGYSIRPVLLHPRSRGSVRLRSATPDDPVRVLPGFFSAREDLDMLRRGVRLGRELGASAPLAGFRAGELSPGPDVVSDDELDAWLRSTAMTAHHPCGTCRMGSNADAVVDPELKVRNVPGLRIADASVMPDLVSGNINATVLMIAERCASLVLHDANPRGAAIGAVGQQ